MADLTIHNLRPRLEERLRRLADLQGLHRNPGKALEELAQQGIERAQQRILGGGIAQAGEAGHVGHQRGAGETGGEAVDEVATEALSIGVDVIEDRVRKHLLNTREQVALKQAIDQIQKVPDAAFGMIGKVPPKG